MVLNDLKDKCTVAMHGNGCCKGLNKTNSLEAFQYWYDRGVRIFEMDLKKLSDGKYVALGWHVNHVLRQAMSNCEIFERQETYPSDWFVQQRLFARSIKGGVTPLALDRILELLKSTGDMIVMFDLFDDKELEVFAKQLAQAIGEDKELFDRILVEAYTEEQLKALSDADAPLQPIYCVRDTRIPYASVSPERLSASGVRFISYPYQFTKKYAGELKTYHEHGFIIFSVSRTNIRMRAKQRMGINVNIVDYYYHGVAAPIQFLDFLRGCVIREDRRLFFRRLIKKNARKRAETIEQNRERDGLEQ